MNELSEIEINKIRELVGNKLTKKTEICKLYRISYYELQKILGKVYEKK